MSESVRQHLPVIVVVMIVGAATVYLLLSQVLGNVNSMDVDSFSTSIFGIPCVIFFICATVITLTAHRIGRQLYVVVVTICLTIGIISMVITSNWMSNPENVAALLANSDENATITPIINSPLTVLRDIAAFFVAPTVGCILGAWLGSKFHPMTSDSTNIKKSNKKKQ